MPLQGPIILASDAPAPALAESLTAAGASPIVEARVDAVAAAIPSVHPAAIVLADGATAYAPAVFAALAAAVAAEGKPFIPVIACVPDGTVPAFKHALPAASQAGPARLIARLRSALRVRTLHATVLRRTAALKDQGIAVPDVPAGDPIEDATVVVAGRGRAYPALTTAIGARMGLIGALSLDTAAKLLDARDVDGVVVGDGFNRRMVEGFLAELGADARFRDLPVAVIDDVADAVEAERLPNLECAAGAPALMVERMAPLVRLHAFAARLRRMMASLDGKGVLDPDTGLHTRDAFMVELARVVVDAQARDAAFSLARISLDNLTDRRASLDAARIVSCLIRHADFACRDDDGTLLLAFTDTALRSAHVVARRIASVLRHTIFAPGQDPRALDPTVAIAARKSRDTAATLIARVTPETMVAAS
jgi:GGDEF domain-containing protein